jgi:hypothetical protein
MIAISIQGIFNGFMLSVLFLKTKADFSPATIEAPIIHTGLNLEESR